MKFLVIITLVLVIVVPSLFAHAASEESETIMDLAQGILQAKQCGFTEKSIKNADNLMVAYVVENTPQNVINQTLAIARTYIETGRLHPSSTPTEEYCQKFGEVWYKHF